MSIILTNCRYFVYHETMNNLFESISVWEILTAVVSGLISGVWTLVSATWEASPFLFLALLFALLFGGAKTARR